MKFSAELDEFETETLFNILGNEIIEFTTLSKLNFLEGKIDENRYKWEQSHGNFLIGIKNKLLNVSKT